MNLRNDLPLTWDVLWVGLKQDWLTSKEVSKLVNANRDNLNCEEEIVIDINVNDDDSEAVLSILDGLKGMKEQLAIRIWQLSGLIDIKDSEHSVYEKLRLIEELWSRFDYPESWRDFIYYLPNEIASSEEELYDVFLEFIEREEKEIKQ